MLLKRGTDDRFVCFANVLLQFSRAFKKFRRGISWVVRWWDYFADTMASLMDFTSMFKDGEPELPAEDSTVSSSSLSGMPSIATSASSSPPSSVFGSDKGISPVLAAGVSVLGDSSSISTSPLVADELQLVNNGLVALGMGPLPALEGLSAESSSKIFHVIRKLTSQRRRDILLIESSASRVKKLQSERKRLSGDKKQLQARVKGLESDLSGLNYQIEHDSKVWKREKRVYEEGKKELENRCIRLQTRDTSYQAKMRKKEVEYERLRNRLCGGGTGSSSSSRSSFPSKQKKRGGTAGRAGGASSSSDGGRMRMSENLPPKTTNTIRESSSIDKMAKLGLQTIVNDIYIEKQQELMTENGFLKLANEDMEMELNELKNVIQQQEKVINQSLLQSSPVNVKGSKNDAREGKPARHHPPIAWENVNLNNICDGLEPGSNDGANRVG